MKSTKAFSQTFHFHCLLLYFSTSIKCLCHYSTFMQYILLTSYQFCTFPTVSKQDYRYLPYVLCPVFHSNKSITWILFQNGSLKCLFSSNYNEWNTFFLYQNSAWKFFCAILNFCKTLESHGKLFKYTRREWKTACFTSCLTNLCFAHLIWIYLIKNNLTF